MRLLAAFTLVSLSDQAPGANHLVVMTADKTFAPQNLSVNAGDTVTWRNDDPLNVHNAASQSGVWNTGYLNLGETSTPVLFTTPGFYPYQDGRFGASGMSGVIFVTSVAPGTPATLTSPAILPNGGFRFTVTGLTIDKFTVIERSTNCSSWSPIFTNHPVSTTLNYTNLLPTNPTGEFFRCYQLF